MQGLPVPTARFYLLAERRYLPADKNGQDQWYRDILMLGKKLAELVSFIWEYKAEALSVHSAIESNFYVCHLK